LIALGSKAMADHAVVSPDVSTFFTLFAWFGGDLARPRLECLLNDDMSRRRGQCDIRPHQYQGKTTSPRQGQVLMTSVVAAKVRLANHAGIAYRRLRRYAEFVAAGALKSGSLREQAAATSSTSCTISRLEPFLAILQHICPGFATDRRTHHAGGLSRQARVQGLSRQARVQDRRPNTRNGSKAPKFIVADPAAGNIHKMSQCAVGKAYECGKAGALSRFLYVDDLIPLLLVYKLRMMQQTESTTMATTTTMVGGSYWDGFQKSAMDIH
jgi:hypothetical protein